MIERIEKIINLTKADDEISREIAAIHRELFGVGLHVCVTCPSSVRDAFKRIKVYYEEERIKR